jgi:hypothetical protein
MSVYKEIIIKTIIHIFHKSILNILKISYLFKIISTSILFFIQEYSVWYKYNSKDSLQKKK